MPAVYRVDKFTVPEDARSAFWTNVRRIHRVLRRQPGFLDDSLLELHSGTSRFNAVTIVKWSSEEDLVPAKEAVLASHRAADFDPSEFFEKAGIEADVATYVDAA